MRKFYSTLAIAAFIIYLVSAVLNQSLIWTYWKYVVQSFWEFALFFGSFHFYAKSKYTTWYLTITGSALVGFGTINLVHSIWGVILWLMGFDLGNSLREVFEEYNAIYLITSGCCGIMIGLVYLINYPYIVYGNKEG